MLDVFNADNDRSPFFLMRPIVMIMAMVTTTQDLMMTDDYDNDCSHTHEHAQYYYEVDGEYDHEQPQY